MALEHLVHDGTELTNNAQTLLTFSTNLVKGGAILWGFTIINRDSDRHRVTIHLVPVGAGTSESNCIFEMYIPANRTKLVKGPWHGNSEYFVSAISDDANPDTAVRLTASEEFDRG